MICGYLIFGPSGFEKLKALVNWEVTCQFFAKQYPLFEMVSAALLSAGVML